MRKLAAGLVTFLVIAAGNGLTHGPLNSAFMTRYLSMATRSPADPGFGWLVATWALIALVTSVVADRARSKREAALLGGLAGLLADGTWNMVNAALFVEWSPFFIGVDCAWHLLHGALA